MSAAKRTTLIIGIACIVVFLLVSGLALVDLPHTAEVCSGDVISTDLCEPARLGRSNFGSILVGSGIIACALIAHAIVLRKRN